MSVIARPRWTRQPQGAAKIDWSSALTRNLVDAFLFSNARARSLVKANSVGVLNSSANGIVGTPIGQSAFTKGNGYGGFGIDFTGSASLPSNGYTTLLVMYDRFTYTGNPGTGFLSLSGGALLRFNADFTPRLPSDTSGTVPLALGRNVVITRWAGTSGSCYINGRLSASYSGGAYTLSGTLANIGYQSGQNGFAAKVAALVTFSRMLSDAEVFALSRDPWQIFVPQRRVIYSTAATNNVTATIAPTQAADTASVGATVTNRASLAPTQAADTAASSVAVINRAAIAATQAPDVAASTVTIATVATIAATQAQDVAASSVTITNQVSIAATQAADTAAITVALGVDAAIAATQAPDSASSSVTVIDRAVIAATQAPDSASVTGVITNRASIAATQAADTAAIAVTAFVPIDAIISATQAPDTAVVIVDVESSMQAGVGASGVVNLANTSDGGALYIGAKNVPLTDPPGANVGDGGVVDRFAGILPVTTVYIVVEVDTGYVLQEDDSKIVLEQS